MNNKSKINTGRYWRVAIATPLRRLFDYLPIPSERFVDIRPGTRLQVPFGSRQLAAILIEVVDKTAVPKSKLKTVQAVLDDEPFLTEQDLDFLKWAADYYHHPIGEVLFNALPLSLRKPTVCDMKVAPSKIPQVAKPDYQLNDEQIEAINAINGSSGYQAFLLEGVTGSGKTEVYLQALEQVIAQDKQALVLVPEINLTPQTITRFQQRLAGRLEVMHSKLTSKKREKSWVAAFKGEAQVVIGTRSAIFTPMPKLAVIILDEEHDASFKQQSGFRYTARDLAIKRAQLLNIKVVLGSATPSLESLANVAKKRYQHLPLTKRAGDGQMPNIYLIDLRNQFMEEGLSPKLIDVIHKHLANKGQVLLFLNRRGYAPVLYCHSCGWMATCNHCDAKLIYHLKDNKLICHHCSRVAKVPKHCATCNSPQLQFLGMGTERLEAALQKHFQDAKVVRIDSDTTRKKGQLDDLLSKIHGGEADILVGTQMMAKGHHFPNVTLVAIIDADSGLYSADFRASERTLQQVIQVAGRAGRADKLGEVYIQTHLPDHPFFQALIKHDYPAQSQQLLRERQNAMLPPYSAFTLFRAEAKSSAKAMELLQSLKEFSIKRFHNEFSVFGPIPAPMVLKQGHYRAQLLVQSAKRSVMQKVLPELIEVVEHSPLAKSVKWSVDVDPIDMA